MNIAIRYDTKTGNTKKLADAIAEEVGVPAKLISKPVEEPVDLLFLGGAMYAFSISPELKEFIKTLDPQQVKKVVVFSSAALLPSAYKNIRHALEKQGITVSDQEFHCYGAFKFARKGHPDAQDLAAIKKFAADVVASESSAAVKTD